MTEFKGGCLCGAVRYAANAEPAFMANCHCDDCQKSSAAGHMSLIGLPKDAVEFSRQAVVYALKATPWDRPHEGVPHFDKMPPRG